MRSNSYSSEAFGGDLSERRISGVATELPRVDQNPTLAEVNSFFVFTLINEVRDDRKFKSESNRGNNDLSLTDGPAPPYFFNTAGQFRTAVNGSAAAFSFGTTARKRWPSADASYSNPTPVRSVPNKA